MPARNATHSVAGGLDIPCWILDIQFLEKPEHRSEAGLMTDNRSSRGQSGGHWPTDSASVPHRRKASTTAGSNCVPLHRRNSSIARTEVMALR